MKIRLNVCGGISSKRHKVYILSYKLNLHFFTDMERKLGLMYVVAFYQKREKCTF